MPAGPLASALIALPLGAAIVAFVAGRRVAVLLGIAVSVAQCGLAVALAQSVLAGGPQTCRIGGWQAPLGIDLRIDGLGVLFLGAAAIVSLSVSVYAAAYFQPLGGESEHGGGAAESFWPLWLFQSAALSAALLSSDIFNLYVTLELLTLAAVGLIGLAGHVTALVAAIRYLFIALAGSLFYLLGVALTYGAYGTVDWQLLGEAARADAASRCALALMTIGLAVKTALFPLHFWLPPAHASAPPPVSALLSGLVVKASFVILLRIWFYGFAPVTTGGAAGLLGGLGAAAIVWGSVQAIRQERVKLLIAYSTVAQIGYLFLVFALAGGEAPMLAWRGTAYLAVAHACAKAAAFLAVGTLARAAGSDELRQWGGLARQEPVCVLALALAGVSLMGLPPSGGFIAKWLLLKAAASGGQWGLAAVVLLGGLLAAIYLFRVLAQTLSTAQPPRPTQPVPLVMRWAPLLPALAAIIFGMVTTETLQVLEIGSPFPAAAEETP